MDLLNEDVSATEKVTSTYVSDNEPATVPELMITLEPLRFETGINNFEENGTGTMINYDNAGY